MDRAGLRDLPDRVRGEPACAVEPALVASAPGQRQERVAIPCGAVAEAGPLRDRTRAPRQLASGQREVLVENVAETR